MKCLTAYMMMEFLWQSYSYESFNEDMCACMYNVYLIFFLKLTNLKLNFEKGKTKFFSSLDVTQRK